MMRYNLSYPNDYSREKKQQRQGEKPPGEATRKREGATSSWDRMRSRRWRGAGAAVADEALRLFALATLAGVGGKFDPRTYSNKCARVVLRSLHLPK